MKPMTLSLAFLSVALLAYNSSAQERAKRPDGQPGPTAGRDGGRGPGQAGRNARGTERDPAQLVARLMQEFDKDGDQKLDSAELTALMTSMRERRGAAVRDGAQGRPGQRRQGQAGQGRGQQRAGQGKPGAEGRRRPTADEAGNPGGKRPKRPDEE